MGEIYRAEKLGGRKCMEGGGKGRTFEQVKWREY